MISDVPATTPHQALYRRWRAQTFAQIVGQDAVVTTLRNAVRLGRLGHAFLFVGPRGTGKTSMARILAKAVNCQDLRAGEPCDGCPPCISIREGRALDVVELDAASNNRVDDMRELLPRVYTAASDLRHKVFIIDEVQRIKEGWDVLLKTLEEPPDGVLFIFCTTDPSQIRPAVVSRLQRYTFRPLPDAEIRGKLERILETEGRHVDPGAIDLIAQLAAGGMRDAESMLDQVLSTAADPITEPDIRDLLGLADQAAVDAFLDALAHGQVLKGIEILDRLEAEGRDLVAFAEQAVAALRDRLVSSYSGSDRTQTSLLASTARRLSGIDASRAGLGGYRWQLELALLAAGSARSAASAAMSLPATTPLPAAHSEPAAMDPPDSKPSVPSPVAERAEMAPSPETKSTSGATPAAPAEPLPNGEDGDLLARLQRGWPEVVAFVARNPANRPLISACRPVAVSEGIVVLGFPEDQAFLRDIAERKRSALEEGLQHVLGRSVGVRCVAANVEMLAPAAADSADLVAQARRIFEDDLVDVHEIS